MGQILVVSLASLWFSFLCSLCEAALYAVTPSQVETMRAQGRRGGWRLARLRERMDEAIAGILTVNTIAHTVGAAWAGALVAEHYGPTWVAFFAAGFTFAILFLTEILPKSMGVAWASTLSVRVVWVIQAMVWAVWPLAKLCMLVMRFITRHAPEQGPTEQEIMVMTDLAAREGAILPEESRWVKNALRLNNIEARDLMTPRRAVYTLSAELPLSMVKPRAEHWVHSRVPVTEDNDPNRVIGVVLRRTVFDSLMRDDQQTTLRQLMRPAMVVPEHMRGHQLLERFISQRQQLAAVVDDAERLVGVVSLEDVLEHLLGRDIVAEHDSHPKMRELERERERFHREGAAPQ